MFTRLALLFITATAVTTLPSKVYAVDCSGSKAPGSIEYSSGWKICNGNSGVWDAINLTGVAGTCTGNSIDYDTTANKFKFCVSGSPQTANCVLQGAPCASFGLCFSAGQMNTAAMNGLLWCDGTWWRKFSAGTVVALGAFSITGITGGTDTNVNSYLTDTSAVKVNFGASANATSYSAEIKDAAGTTVICAATSGASSPVTMSSCSLSTGTSYRAYVASSGGGSSRNAANTSYSFTVNTGGGTLQPYGFGEYTGYMPFEDESNCPPGGDTTPTGNACSSYGDICSVNRTDGNRDDFMCQ